MKTLRKLIYGETFLSIALVTFGFLTLFTFFDLVDELQNLGRSNPVDGATYQMRHALLYVTLLAPSRLYELLPISVLIGTIFVMARLAQSSEYTILRTSGLDPWRALRLLLTLAVAKGPLPRAHHHRTNRGMAAGKTGHGQLCGQCQGPHPQQHNAGD